MKSDLVHGPCRCTKHRPWSRPSASGAKAVAPRQRSRDAQREAAVSEAEVLTQSEAGAMALRLSAESHPRHLEAGSWSKTIENRLGTV